MIRKKKGRISVPASAGRSHLTLWGAASGYTIPQWNSHGKLTEHHTPETTLLRQENQFLPERIGALESNQEQR